ncbi:hypothetical protein KIH27_08725 [Mycobacterium sp. M1]|uniref:Uncharacterized protein n=1 Tax=Mycolicibacter acidiphilus TaxID=2835306 RepID=A0ABS5RI26_9MYCO|nr:hypothetical protein [Mycolicibacter acidiphilus]MBS9533667.1 hypothetical protein [Mycolicibacter acidiphilus]
MTPGHSAGESTGFFRVGYFGDFHYGEPAIVVGADRAGMRAWQRAIRAARQRGQATFTRHGVEHTIRRHDGSVGVELRRDRTNWCLADTRLEEILDLGRSLLESGRAGHHYLDFRTDPAVTVILSVDEYVDDAMFDEAAERSVAVGVRRYV